MSKEAGSANVLIYQKALEAEVLQVEADMIKCEINSSLVLFKEGECEQCDPNDEAGYAGWLDSKWDGRFDNVGGKLACYLYHRCVDENNSAVAPIIIYIAKPFSLRTTPFDNKTLKINEGQSDEYTITYRYDATGRKRTVTYSKENERCTRGSHTEVIWPPYRERVVDADGEDVPGDTIMYLENKTSPDVSIDMNTTPKDAAELGPYLREPNNPGSEARWNIDTNIDGRTWSDDCGKGGGGGSVWV